MRCFHHHDRDAVGLCRHCERALCPDCVVVVEDVVSCSAHQAEVLGALLMVRRSVATQARVSPLHWLQFVAFLLVGASLTVGGLVLLTTGEVLGGLGAALMAVVFLGFAASVLRWIRAKGPRPAS